MEDRFGALPPEARALLRTLEIKIRVRRLGALGIEAGTDRVALHLSDKTTLDPAKVLSLVNRKGSTWRLAADMRLSTRRAAKDGLEAAEAALEEIEALG
jgi:transcription-repair coupling factor (superfamily II helicase)